MSWFEKSKNHSYILLFLVSLSTISFLIGLFIKSNSNKISKKQDTETSISITIAGDVANSSSQTNIGAYSTAKIIEKLNPDLVLVAGDLIYNDNYDLYDSSWGSFKEKTYPSRGNHDNLPIFDEYWGPDKAATANRNNYSFNSYDNNWHFIAINSNVCNTKKGAEGCDASSETYSWLKKDLEINHGKNVLAYWHHPRYSSLGIEPNQDDHYDNDFMDPIWKLLVEYRVDIVVTGHLHTYERYNQKTDGIRYFLVGTGGTTPNACGEGGFLGKPAVCTSDWGVLNLNLKNNFYEWTFHRASPGVQIFDQGQEPVND